jgi:hypothetical protein
MVEMQVTIASLAWSQVKTAILGLMVVKSLKKLSKKQLLNWKQPMDSAGNFME